MNIINAAVLGIVEGITEFLPISSTGHMVLASELMHLTQSEFVKSFEIIIQLGAILAVVVLFWKKYATDWQCLRKAMIAFIPTGILGFIFYKTVRQYIGNEYIILWALLLGGLFIILFEHFYETDGVYQGDISIITNKQAIAIGVLQSV